MRALSHSIFCCHYYPISMPFTVRCLFKPKPHHLNTPPLHPGPLKGTRMPEPIKYSSSPEVTNPQSLTLTSCSTWLHQHRGPRLRQHLHPHPCWGAVSQPSCGSPH